MSQEADDRAVQVLVAEFQFVAGLIPFYRRAELIVLGATGAFLSVIVAALATLEAAEGSQRQAEGLLLALGAWVPVLLLLIEVMALTRIARASRYIYRRLHPLACELGWPHMLLEFERAPSAELIKMMGEQREKDDDTPGDSPSGQSRALSFREKLVINFFSSTPLILAIGIPSVALAAGGIILDPRALTVGFSIPAAVGVSALGLYGIAFTRAHEARMGEEIAGHIEPDGCDISD